MSEVFYYVALAAEAEGRASYAESSFREYLTRTPGGRWTRAALRHLGEGTPAPSRRPGASGGPGPRTRIAAFGTVYATGAIPAPLIDVAWRAHPALLDECLDGVRVASSVRVAVELEIDARGEVTRATVKAPPPLEERFVRCVEGRSRGRSSSRRRERGRATGPTRGIRRQSRGRRSSSPPDRGSRYNVIVRARPRYIAVEGPIGVGKSSLAHILGETLSARVILEEPAENPFLGAFYKDRRRHAMSAQLFFLLQRYTQQGELAQGDLFSRGTS